MFGPDPLTPNRRTAGQLGRAIRKVWIFGIVTIVLACVISPLLVQPLFWLCLGLSAWKLTRFMLGQSSPNLAPDSDTCRRCESLLYRTADKQWVAFAEETDCAGRRHQPFGESAPTGAR
jgi:hypothetical protein